MYLSYFPTLMYQSYLGKYVYGRLKYERNRKCIESRAEREKSLYSPQTAPKIMSGLNSELEMEKMLMRSDY